jgi:hypothetical protein
MDSDVYRMEECRRCGKRFENGGEPQGVCDECLYLDWHEVENELEENADSYDSWGDYQRFKNRPKL